MRNILKFIYSKYLYEADRLDLSDLWVYTYTLDALIEYGKKDVVFLQRWKSFLTSARRLLPELQRTCTFKPFRTKNNLHISYAAEKFGTELTFSPRAYFGLEKSEYFTNLMSFAVVQREDLKKYTPAAYIGVGYRDKGACRFKHEDGSPSWQEVASSNQKLTGEDFKKERDELLIQPILKGIIQGSVQTPEEKERMMEKIFELELDLRMNPQGGDQVQNIMLHDPNQSWLAKYCRIKPERTVKVKHSLSNSKKL